MTMIMNIVIALSRQRYACANQVGIWGSGGTAPLILNFDSFSFTSRSLYATEKTRNPLNRRLGGSQSRSEHCG
jgi:hypothetical protein